MGDGIGHVLQNNWRDGLAVEINNAGYAAHVSGQRRQRVDDIRVVFAGHAVM
jgi:hypothetical protein